MRLASTLAAAVLTVGASARLSRVVTDDLIGEWLVKDPIDRAMNRYADGLPPDAPEPWWWRYREGLDCPWCVGFWLAAGVVATGAATRGTRAEGAWVLAAGALSANLAATLLLQHLDRPEEDR